jgi:hypothetical protein
MESSNQPNHDKSWALMKKRQQCKMLEVNKCRRGRRFVVDINVLYAADYYVAGDIDEDRSPKKQSNNGCHPSKMLIDAAARPLNPLHHLTREQRSRQRQIYDYPES